LLTEFNVKIKNWRTYQTRTDLKSMNYFRIASNIFIDPMFSKLTASHKLIWFYLLSVCAQSNTELIHVCGKLGASLCKTRADVFRRAILKFEQIQLLELLPVTDSCLKIREEKKSKEKKRKGKGSATVVTDPNPNLLTHWLVDLWNENCNRLPKARIPISSSRLKKIKSRTKDIPEKETWKEAIEKLSQSNFCNGMNDRGWTADFNFILNPSSLDKILEDKYKNRKALNKNDRHFLEQAQRIESGELS